MKDKLKKNKKVRALIIGAGTAGRQLARDIQYRLPQYLIVGFLDDEKRGVVQRLKILGTLSVLKEILHTEDIDEVIVAIPSLSHYVNEKIFKICAQNGKRCKVIPASSEIIEGNVTMHDLREVEIDDILRRPPSKEDFGNVKAVIRNQTFLVTGGAGSIGSELVKQLAFLKAGNVVVVDNNELAVFNLRNRNAKYDNITYYIGDINDTARISNIISKEKPDVIFHAAAYKHVHLMEKNIYEAIRNNIFGSKTLIDLAIQQHVKKFILVSSDKAVNPASVMGKTKRVAEKMIACYRNMGTVFNIVRFGNVIGSSGSVIPLFREQIASGGPVTVTSRTVARYFMSIPEAVQLIVYTHKIKAKNKIFLLDMGKPIKIIDIAKKMIALKGMVAGRDVDIVFTGLKKGEKIMEDLYASNVSIRHTENKKIYYLADEDSFNQRQFLALLSLLQHNYQYGDDQTLNSYLDNLIKI
jgi:FlaA1/EpsC-like NDP-sugar epimerase